MQKQKGKKDLVKCENCNKIIKGNAIFVRTSDNTKGYDFICENCHLREKNKLASKFY